MYKKIKFGLFMLAIFSPIGLVANGTAWGEWGAEEIESVLGYVPQGINSLGGLWQALLPEYSMKFFGESGSGQSAGYIFSAIIGSLLVYGGTVLLAKFLVQRNKEVCKSK